MSRYMATYEEDKPKLTKSGKPRKPSKSSKVYKQLFRTKVPATLGECRPGDTVLIQGEEAIVSFPFDRPRFVRWAREGGIPRKGPHPLDPSTPVELVSFYKPPGGNPWED